MLDHLIKIAADHFAIRSPDDWCKVRPDQIRGVKGCGPSTLDHLRMYLAARGLTLKDDATVQHWQEHLLSARLGGQVSKLDRAVITPFVVLVDTHEQKPFSFAGYAADADQQHRPLIVATEWKELGATRGDYSIKGMEGHVHIERKGLGDAQSTFLSHSEQLDRWLKTLEFLASIETAAVVIESSFLNCIETLQARGRRSLHSIQKTFHRQVLAWQQDYRVPFHFCDTRRFAEQTTLAILRRHFKRAAEGGVRRRRLEAVDFTETPEVALPSPQSDRAAITTIHTREAWDVDAAIAAL